STQLTVFAKSSTSSTYAGVITGSGSGTVTANDGKTQTLAGNNSYTGTTTITGGTLRIDGTSSGQGDYSIAGSGFPVTTTLTRSGTIGLVANGTITVGGVNTGLSRLSTGPNAGVGTLHVTTSGTGKVIFSDNSIFLVDIAA